MMVSDIGDIVDDLAKKAGIKSQADMDAMIQKGAAALSKSGSKPMSPGNMNPAFPIQTPDAGIGMWPFMALVGGVGILAVAFFAGKGGKVGKAADTTLKGLGLLVPRG